MAVGFRVPAVGRLAGQTALRFPAVLQVLRMPVRLIRPSGPAL